MFIFPEDKVWPLFRDARNRLAVILSNLAKIAEERGEVIFDEQGPRLSSGPYRSPLNEILSKKAETVAATTPFRVAVVGEFSRGKTTLINALLGREVLPTDFRPNTAVKTVLRAGTPERFRVTYMDPSKTQITYESEFLRQNLSEFISDMAVNNYDQILAGKDGSLAQAIKEVEVFCDAEFLKTREVELIDTPGLGSVFSQHREVTYGIIPSVDATIFVIQADPGLGESEILFLKYVREYVDQIFFVVTKADLARSPDELQGMLDFARHSIESQTSIQVEHIYPVSALKVLEDKEDQSGFDKFLPALEQFLIGSSGIARLQAPQTLARYHLKRMLSSVDSDLNALDKDIDVLRQELSRLQQEQAGIRKSRDKLLAYIKNKMEDLYYSTTSGVEYLPALIQKNVEQKIDELNLKQLPNALDHIQPVIKDTVMEWLNSKDQHFRSTLVNLQSRVFDDLQDILGTIFAEKLEFNQKSEIEFQLPSSGGSTFSEIGQVLIKTGTTGIIGFTAGMGAASILAVVMGITSMAVPPLGLLLIPFISALIPSFNRLANSPGAIRAQIKTKLLQPMPNSKGNIYAAVVNGFQKDGQKIPGVKQAIEKQFLAWSDQFERVTSATVNTSLESRLLQLQHQIAEKESGHQDQAFYWKQLNEQKERLTQISDRLDNFAQLLGEIRPDEESGIQKMVIDHPTTG